MIDRIKSGFPTVLVFWTSFLLIMKFADDRFLLLAFYFGLFYFVRSKSRFRPDVYIKDVALQFIIAILAVITSQNAILSISLNLVTVFLIAYIFMNQTSPGGYIIYLLEFVFLQLKQLQLTDIPMMSIFLICFYIIVFLIFYIKNSYTKQKDNLIYLNKALPIIAEHIKSSLSFIDSFKNDNNLDDNLDTQTRKTISELYKSLANSITFPYKFREENVYEYYLIVILKRISSLCNSFKDDSELIMSSTEYRESANKYLRSILSDIEAIDIFINSNEPDSDKYAVKKIDSIMNSSFSENKIFEKSISEIFYLLKVILEDENSIDTIFENHILTDFKLFKEFIRNYGYKVFYQMNEFRLAFALRISLITASTITASLFIPLQYSYWLPINAVLLVKPKYEESQVYVKKRFVGTVLGSIILAIILSVSESKALPYAVCFIASVFFYSSDSISWTRSFASALFGTSLAAISMGVGTVVEYKIFFIVIASLSAIMINRYFFPKDKYSVFIYNCKNIGIISLDNLDSSINNSNLSTIADIKDHDNHKNHRDRLNTIHTFVQIYYYLKDISIFIDSDRSQYSDSKYSVLYNKLIRFTESIQNLSFLLYTGIEFNPKDIERVRKSIEIFIYRVQIDPDSAIKALDKIDKRINSAFVRAERRNH